jgi:hypothetical protein
VILKTFHNTVAAPDDIDDSENYWKLLDQKGIVVDKRKKHPAFPGSGEMLLTKFSCNIEAYGLHCHNTLPNTLWIFVSDLKFIAENKDVS